MENIITVLQMPVDTATSESSIRVMNSLRQKTFQEHSLTNTAMPFIEKQPIYLAAYERSLRSLNHRYILECRGEEE